MTKLFQASPVLILLCCAGSLLGHLYLLDKGQLDWFQSPISQLSKPGGAWQHAVALGLFAAAQALLAVLLKRNAASIVTRCIQALALVNAVLILSLGYVFTSSNTALHTGILIVIASVTGTIMACLAAQHMRLKKRFTAWVNSIFLLVWLALVPLFLVIDAGAIGAYERCVGIIYTVWLCSVALMPLHYNSPLNS